MKREIERRQKVRLFGIPLTSIHSSSIPICGQHSIKRILRMLEKRDRETKKRKKDKKREKTKCEKRKKRDKR